MAILQVRTELYSFYIQDRVAITRPREIASDSRRMKHPQVAPEPDEDGEPLRENHYREPSARTVRNWKKKLGEYLVKDVMFAEVERRGMEWPREDVVQGRLKSFPKNYKLLTHVRYQEDGKTRLDHYLFCSEGRFQSPPEFGPHLAWLLLGQPRDERGWSTCACCYCKAIVTGGRATRRRASQKQITEERYSDLDDYFTRPVKAVRRESNPGDGRAHYPDDELDA